jgi:hypothetical protein
MEELRNALSEKHHALYVMATMVMAFLGVLAIVGIELLRPGQDNTILHGLVIGFLTPTTMSLLALMKANDTHTIVNSRMSALLELTQKSAYARGQLEGPALPPQPVTPGDKP